MKRALLFTLAAACVSVPLGCSSDDDDDDRYTRSRDRVIVNERISSDRYDDGRMARWPDNDDRIPAGAQPVGRVQGGNIVYEPREDGRLYLFDSTDNKVIWSARVDDGDDFTFSPARGAATLDDRPVNLPRLGAGHGFTLYFLADDD